MTDEAETWYVKAGVRQHLNPLGHTVFYGEHMDGDQSSPTDTDTGSLELWGVGIVQEIDAAAMSMWLSYRNIEADNGVAGDLGESLDFQYVKFGALINF